MTIIHTENNGADKLRFTLNLAPKPLP